MLIIYIFGFRFEKNVTENKTLSQNVLIRDDKISALEERYDTQFVSTYIYIYNHVHK